MEGNVFVGHYCPRCRTAIGVFVVVEGQPRCPDCGGALEAASGGPETQVLANVTCKGCGSEFGMVSAVGGKATCPRCGQSLTD